MDARPYNILERIIQEKVNEPGVRMGPRILVSRRSLAAPEFQQWFSGVPDQPGYPLRKLLSETVEGVDWTRHFILDPLANTVERELIELSFSEYSTLERDSRRQMVFSFSSPIPADGAHLLYGMADQGFLWAHGFLCRFEGGFESPTGYELMNVWRS
ncbi:MAG: hypothetical protein V4726_14505 [Verrucomicrobiota bacterium]